MYLVAELKQAMWTQGIETITELSTRSGISRTTIYKIFDCDQTVRLSTLSAVFDALALDAKIELSPKEVKGKRK